MWQALTAIFSFLQAMRIASWLVSEFVVLVAVGKAIFCWCTEILIVVIIDGMVKNILHIVSQFRTLQLVWSPGLDATTTSLQLL